MSNMIDVAGGRLYATCVVAECKEVFREGLAPLEVTSARANRPVLIGAAFLPRLLGMRLPLPGSPPVRRMVQTHYSVMTPLALNLATGVGVPEVVQNRDIFYVVTRLRRLQATCMYLALHDRNLLSESVQVSTDPQARLTIDEHFLCARQYWSPKKAVFGSGALAYDRIIPAAFESVVCVDETTRAVLLSAVTAAGLSIPVIADSRYFHPNKAVRP